MRDSAGIQIVDNSAIAPDDLPAWSLSPNPILELGTLDGGEYAEQFNEIVGATRLPNNSIVIADGRSREIRYFGGDGNHLQTIGGPGEGPGELNALFSLDRIRGDTLVANKWPVGQAAWFESDGNLSSIACSGLTGPA